MSNDAVVTVRDNSEGDFLTMCNSLVADGYTMKSSSCNIENCNGDYIADIWMAVFILEK